MFAIQPYTFISKVMQTKSEILKNIYTLSFIQKQNMSGAKEAQIKDALAEEIKNIMLLGVRDLGDFGNLR